jgi:SAM-dependent methyltransferase
MTEFNFQRPDPRVADLLTDYPADLFTERLYQSIELADRYCIDLALDLLHRLDILPLLSSWRSSSELAAELHFNPRFLNPLNWLLNLLAKAQLLVVQKQDPINRYRASSSLRPPELAELRNIGLTIDPGNAATLDLLEAAAAVYPNVAQGKSSGEEALFGAGNVNLWLTYFNNNNPLYAVNNWIAAYAAAQRLATKSRLRILEIGAGAGSASEALLHVLIQQHLVDRIDCYVITEPSPFFRRRAERTLKAKFRDVALQFQAMDMNKLWSQQDINLTNFDLIYAVNALHVAYNLPFTIDQAHSALASGGWLIAGESMRPTPNQAIHAELIFQILDSFNDVITDTEIRPNPGFLSHQQWRQVFRIADFKPIELTPDLEQIHPLCGVFYTGAICGQRS